MHHVIAYKTRGAFGRGADGFEILDAADPEGSRASALLPVDVTDQQIGDVCAALGLDLVEIIGR